MVLGADVRGTVPSPE
jgi:hypothetical protein